jgi:hypothetical protein
MKKTVSIFISAAMVALFLAACWNPSVTEVPITAPWDKMDLPLKENARVWFSNDKELRVAHKGRRADVAQSYIKALDKGGWKITEEPLMDENIIINKYEKNGQRIMVKVNDFEGGAGVFINFIN